MTDNKKKLGERIRLYRMSRGMSQEKLASLVGVKRNTISMYETGKREPDMDVIEALADVFNVSMRDMVPEDKGHDVIIPQENRRILDMYDKLNPENQIRLEAYLAGLLDTQQKQ